MKRIINKDKSLFGGSQNQPKKPINKLFGSEIPKPKIITIYLLKMPDSAVAQTCNLSTQETESGHCSKLLAVLGDTVFQVSLA